MGFMDKAKKMAEQAQSKLDEAQKQFNEKQGNQQASQGPVTQYDKHGRPVPPADAAPRSPAARGGRACRTASPDPAPQAERPASR